MIISCSNELRLINKNECEMLIFMHILIINNSDWRLSFRILIKGKNYEVQREFLEFSSNIKENQWNLHKSFDLIVS